MPSSLQLSAKLLAEADRAHGHWRDREMLGRIRYFGYLFFPGLLLGAYAQSRVKINIAKYSQVGTQDGITRPKWRAGRSIRRAFAT
jgi:hypothetical protein